MSSIDSNTSNMYFGQKNQFDQDFEQRDFNLSLCASHLAVITLSGDLVFCSKNISLHLNFKPWRFTIYSKKLILIRKKFRRSIPLRKEWQKSVKTSLVSLRKLFLNFEISACPEMSRITWFLMSVTVSACGIESMDEDVEHILSMVRL